MTITRLTLHSFGRYKEKTITLAPGFNVLYGANGAGKSTLIQFLLWMLYDPENRKRGIREKIRERFRPWDGSALWGELEWTQDGVPYRMERFYDTASKKRFSVHHGITGEEVTEAFLPTPGEVLFGFGQEAFLRTFFVGQLATPFEKEGKEDELQAALMNLSTSGNETVSAQKALKTLEDAARAFRLKTGRGGSIPATEANLDRLYALADERRQKEADLHLKIQRLEQVEQAVARERQQQADALKEATAKRAQQIAQLEQEGADMGKELERIALLLEGVDLARLNEAEEACRALASAAERRKTIQNEKEELSVRQAVAKEQEKQQQDQAQSACRQKKLGLVAVGAVSLVVGLVSAFFVKFVVFLFALLGIVLMVLGFMQKPRVVASVTTDVSDRLEALAKESQTIEEQETAANATLVAIFGRAVTLDDVRLTVTRYQEQRLLQMKAEELEKRRALLEKSGVDVMKNDQGLQSQLTELGRLKAELENGFAGLPDLRSLTEEITTLEESLKKQRRQYEALQLAQQWIFEQAEVLRNSFGPRLNEAAAKVLSELTDGAVGGVRISGDYKMELTDAEGNHALDYFSNGTVDQAYLSLRLGILDLLEKNGDGPLLLDDVFCQYDEKRLRAGLRFLAERAAFQQILYCTCRREEYPDDTMIINLDGHF